MNKTENKTFSDSKTFFSFFRFSFSRKMKKRKLSFLSPRTNWRTNLMGNSRKKWKDRRTKFCQNFSRLESSKNYNSVYRNDLIKLPIVKHSFQNDSKHNVEMQTKKLRRTWLVETKSIWKPGYNFCIGCFINKLPSLAIISFLNHHSLYFQPLIFLVEDIFDKSSFLSRLFE